MTNIIVDRFGSHCEVSIMGHSGYGDKGSDIVCAGVSTLAYTLLQAVYALLDRGDITEAEHREGEGELFLAYDTAPGCMDPELVLDVILDGWALLEEKFPQNVRLAVRSGENSTIDSGMLWM